MKFEKYTRSESRVENEIIVLEHIKKNCFRYVELIEYTAVKGQPNDRHILYDDKIVLLDGCSRYSILRSDLLIYKKDFDLTIKYDHMAEYSAGAVLGNNTAICHLPDDHGHISQYDIFDSMAINIYDELIVYDDKGNILNLDKLKRETEKEIFGDNK